MKTRLKNKKYSVGIDIGGTKILAVLFDGRKAVRKKIVLTPKNRKKFVSALLGVADGIISGVPRTAIAGIGAGAAGISDPKKQKIILSPNIPVIAGLKIGELLSRRFHLKTRLDNDARCFLRAEMALGKARGRKNVIGVSLGTGVGGAIAVDGKIIAGVNFSAGEAGHMVLNAATGETFEDLASEKFLKRFFRGEPADLEILAEKGDRRAREIYEALGRNLGVGLGNLINAFNPELIVVGGGLAKSKKFIESAMKKTVEAVVKNPLAKKTKIVFSTSKRESAAVGASLLMTEAAAKSFNDATLLPRRRR
ncbi:MAG: ROK family protein [Parcubacteria group bacterium]|nr:ROK family protein [Parcubacteria group bacterium]